MAAAWQDHVHIMATRPAQDEGTTYEYAVSAKNLRPTGLPEYTVIASPRRALDGTLRTHTLQSAGSPILFIDYTPVIRVNSISDIATLAALLGTTVYYVPNYHDQAAHQSYERQVFFDKMGVPESPGPTVPYLFVPTHFVDND